MNIVVVTWRDLANPQAGGAEVLVDRLLVELSRRGHDVTLVCGGPVGLRPYRVIEAGGTYSQYLLAPLAVMRKCADADVVIDAENGIPFFSPLWRKRPRVCLVHHLHTDQWADRFPKPIARSAAFLESNVMPVLYRQTDFVAVSESTRDSLQRIGVSSDRITVIESGVDIPSAIGGVSLLKSTTPLFVCLGRQVPHKRTELVLEAWSLIAEDVGGELVILGDGPDHPAITKQAGTVPQTRVLGKVDEQERTELLHKAWFQINATHHEGWGITVLEAAAARTPTLAFDVPGIRDAVLDGKTGILIPEQVGTNAKRLAEEWKSLAIDAQLRMDLAETAYERAVQQTWERSIDEWEQLLMRLAPG